MTIPADLKCSYCNDFVTTGRTAGARKREMDLHQSNNHKDKVTGNAVTDHAVVAEQSGNWAEPATTSDIEVEEDDKYNCPDCDYVAEKWFKGWKLKKHLKTHDVVAETEVLEAAAAQDLPSEPAPAVASNRPEVAVEPSITQGSQAEQTPETVTASVENDRSAKDDYALSSNDDTEADAIGDWLGNSTQENTILKVGQWAVFSVGVGECGSKLSATMNLKPKDFSSRHPVYYPVHASCFDTDGGIENTLGKDEFKGRIPIQTFPVPSPKLDFTNEKNASISHNDVATMNEFFARTAGVGGVPYKGYLAFRQLFDTENKDTSLARFQQDIKDVYVENPLWKGVPSVVSDPVTSVALITFNSARGGTGSGGAPVVHKFFSEMCDAKQLSLDISLNVSVLPSESDKNITENFAKHAVACFYRMRNHAEVHGVIIVSNERAETVHRFADPRFTNSMVHEMLTPVVVSPMAKYTTGAPNLDPQDLRSLVLVNNDAGVKSPGLCVIGMAEIPIADLQNYSDGTTLDCEALLGTLVEMANEQTTEDWQCRPGQSKFLAYLIAPGSVLKNRPTDLVRAIQTKILEKARLRTESNQSSWSGTQESQLGGNVKPKRFQMTGQATMMEMDSSATVKLVILYSNVRIASIDDLVEEALEIDLDPDEDGWDRIGMLQQADINELEITQLSTVLSRDSARVIVERYSPII